MGATIRIAILANAARAKAELVATSSAAADMGRKAKMVAAVGLGALAVGAKKAVDAAAEMNDSIGATQVIFGKASAAVLKYTDTTAKGIGLSKQAALDAAMTFGTFGKSAGLTGDKLSGFSNQMTQLAGDLASFKGGTAQEAVEAIGAAMRGEAEPMRRYGVLLDDSTLKAKAMALGLLKPTKNMDAIRIADQRASLAQAAYTKAVKEHGKNSAEAQRAEVALNSSHNALKKATEGTIPPLTAQQKVLAAQRVILDQTKDAQGDFARTANSAKNKAQAQSAQIQDLTAKLGQALLPAYGALLSVGLKVTGWMSQNTGAVEIAVGVVAGLAGTVLAVSAAMKAWTAMQAVARVATVAWTGVQWLLNAALSANPIGLVVLAVAALVAGIVIAWKHSQTFRNIVTGAFNAVWGAIKAAWSWIRSSWPLLQAVLTAPIRIAVAAVTGAFHAVLGAARGAWNWVRNNWPLLLAILTGPVGLAVRWIVQHWGDIVSTARQLPGKIKAVFANIGGLLIDAGKRLISGFIHGIGSMFGAVKDKLGSLTDSLTSWKGPASKDARLLTKNGKLVINSFLTGLESRYGAVRASLGGFTDSLASSASVDGTVSIDTSSAPGWARELIRLLDGGLTVSLESNGNRGDDALLGLLRDRIRVKGGKASVIGITA